MSQRESSPAAALDDACLEAMNLQIAGRLDDAERRYRGILAAEPGHAAALHCLGMLQVQLQRPAAGLAHLLAALEANPHQQEYWLGYLEALLQAGDLATARSTLALGRTHELAGQPVEDFARRLDAKELETALLELLNKGEFAAAQPAARLLTERHPGRGLGWKILGALLGADEKSEQALAAMLTSVRLLPGDAEAFTNLGVTLSKLQRHADAVPFLENAIRLDGRFQAAHIHLGNVYQALGRYEDAEEMLRQAIELPSDATNPESSHYTSWLFLMSHNPRVDATTLFEAHRRAGERLERRAAAGRRKSHKNRRDPGRRLRIGIVSADLCNHAVASFIEPVLEHLQHCGTLELHAYYNNKSSDEVTLRLRPLFAHWHAIHELSDEALAGRVTADKIDVLMDLSGHTSMNRLGTFAYKPAPIQVSWIGYPGTTGLLAMDYYLADRHFLPPGRFDAQFTEKLAYLPANVPFQPYAAAPPVGPLPAASAGHLTFGSFNRLGKITAATIALWASLLRDLPGARLLIAGVALEDGARKLNEEFIAAGVDPGRLSFHPRMAMDRYLALHHEVDICLDTYPYGGGTTTIHALWMGVPTLTVAGPTPAARQGAAIMGQLGLEEFVAADPEDFIARARHWTRRLDALAALRAGLRERWQDSPARQPALIAAGLEESLRRMWTRWCAGLAPESF